MGVRGVLVSVMDAGVKSASAEAGSTCAALDAASELPVAGGWVVRAPALQLAAWQAMDVWTTWRGLARGAVEGNPLGVALLGHGLAGVVAAKLVVTLVALGIGWVLWRGSATNRRQAVWALRVSVVLMMAVVAWNSLAVQRHGG